MQRRYFISVIDRAPSFPSLCCAYLAIICPVFQVLLSILLSDEFGILGTLRCFHSLMYSWFYTSSEIGFSCLFLKRGVSAHPSWSLIKSRSERRSHVLSALCAHQIPRGVSVPCLAPLRLKGRTGISSMSSSTTPSGASGSQAQSVLVPSTSTSGSNRRVPPPRGSPPRHPSPGHPFGFVQLFHGFYV